MKMKIAKSIMLLLVAVLISNCTNSQSTSTAQHTSTTGIQFFEGTFAEAKAKAKAEGKKIFMDAYASWCGPCKMMQKNTFPDPLVGKVFNEKYVSVAYDMEIGEGLELSKIYPVDAYPTLFFMDADGKILKSELGYRDPAGLVALAE
jgi:thioredoxin 1